MATAFLEKIQIPEGFEEILHDLLKEILREQPENINLFCVEYFKAKVNHSVVRPSFVRNEFGVMRDRETAQQNNEFGNGEPKVGVAMDSHLEEKENDVERANTSLKESPPLKPASNQGTETRLPMNSNSELPAEPEERIRSTNIPTTNSIKEIGNEYMEYLTDSIAKEI